MFIRFFAVLTAGLAIGLLFWLKSIQSDMNPPIAEVSAPLESTAQIQVSEPVQQRLSDGNSQSSEVEAEFEAAQLDWVADDFALQTQFPEQSRPITDASSLKKYLPNQASPISRKTPVGEIELKTYKYRYRADERITGDVRVSGTLDTQLSVTLVQNGVELAAATVSTANDAYQFHFPALNDRWSAEQILVVAKVSSPGLEAKTLSTPVAKQQTQTSIQFGEVEGSYVEGPWLMIPVAVRVKNSGFYRMEANLYSEDTGEPLIHLLNEVELNAGDQTLYLQAHIRALQAKQDEGDYLLSDIVLEQMPSPPDFTTLRTLVPVQPVSVRGYSFSDYVDEDYVDPDSVARLEFLNALSQ